MRSAYIYVLINKSGKVFYVGCTYNPQKRAAEHRYKIESYGVHAYMRRYKIDPIFAIVEEVKRCSSRTKLVAIERRWIDLLRSNGVSLKNFQKRTRKHETIIQKRNIG